MTIHNKLSGGSNPGRPETQGGMSDPTNLNAGMQDKIQGQNRNNFPFVARIRDEKIIFI